MTSLSLCSFSIVSQGPRYILFVVAVALLNSNAESARNMNVTWNSVLPPNLWLAVWDPKFKSENNCQMFHSSNVSGIFFSWPEEDFEFCCGCGISNYTYTLHGPRLMTTTYYDVGQVDACLPYWKCPILSNWVRPETNYATFHVSCEMGDMQKLYAKRLMRVIGINGIVQTALPLVGILEFGVFLAIVALSYCCTWITPHAPTRSWSQALSLLCRKNYGNIVANLVHLCVLVVLGNCFMEATAHSNRYQWESGMFLKWAQYYLLAPSMLTVAIFFHQTADWVAACNSIKDDVPNGDDVANRFVSISEDWRWQPVSGQVVVLVLTGFYCTYNSDNHRTEFVSFLLGVVVVFSIWSGIFSCALLHRSICSLHANLRIFLGYKLHTPPPSRINPWMTGQIQADTLGIEVSVNHWRNVDMAINVV